MKSSVLIVDDEAGVRSSLSGVLRDEGYLVEAVASGEACLDRVSRNAYEVIVLDIWLPEWAGYLITTGLLFLVAAILAVVGRSSMKKIKGKPERTIKNAQDTVSAVKSAS